MEDFVSRINALMSALHLNSIRKFSDRCHINEHTLGRQMNGDRAVSLETINAILEAFPEVSAEWLLRGTGDMFVSNETVKTNTSSDDTSLMRRMLDNLLGTCEEQRRMIERLNQLKLSNE